MVDYLVNILKVNIIKIVLFLGIKSSMVFVDHQLADNPLKVIKFKSQHEFVSKKLTSNADNREIQGLLSHFRACGSQNYFSGDESIYKTAKVESIDQNDGVEQPQIMWPDCLDPNSHQRLSVLFCNFLYNNNRLVLFNLIPIVSKTFI